MFLLPPDTLFRTVKQEKYSRMWFKSIPLRSELPAHFPQASVVVYCVWKYSGSYSFALTSSQKRRHFYTFGDETLLQQHTDCSKFHIVPTCLIFTPRRNIQIPVPPQRYIYIFKKTNYLSFHPDLLYFERKFETTTLNPQSFTQWKYNWRPLPGSAFYENSQIYTPYREWLRFYNVWVSMFTTQGLQGVSPKLLKTTNPLARWKMLDHLCVQRKHWKLLLVRLHTLKLAVSCF